MATQGLLKPDGLHAGFNDVRSMSQPINHGSTKAGIREDRGPLPEGQICGQYQGPPFMTLTEHLKQQFGIGLAERQVTQFIQDESIQPTVAAHEPA